MSSIVSKEQSYSADVDVYVKKSYQFFLKLIDMIIVAVLRVSSL
jgi:hypothetical protein